MHLQDNSNGFVHRSRHAMDKINNRNKLESGTVASVFHEAAFCTCTELQTQLFLWSTKVQQCSTTLTHQWCREMFVHVWPVNASGAHMSHSA